MGPWFYIVGDVQDSIVLHKLVFLYQLLYCLIIHICKIQGPDITPLLIHSTYICTSLIPTKTGTPL